MKCFAYLHGPQVTCESTHAGYHQPLTKGIHNERGKNVPDHHVYLRSHPVRLAWSAATHCARPRVVESHLRSRQCHCYRCPYRCCSCPARVWEVPNYPPRFLRPDGRLAETSGHRRTPKTISYDPYWNVGATATTRKGDESVVPAGCGRSRYLISADIARYDVVVGLPDMACESLRVGVEQRKNGWAVHGCEGRLSKKAPFSEVFTRRYLFGANTRPLNPHATPCLASVATCLQFCQQNIINKGIRIMRRQARKQ